MVAVRMTNTSLVKNNYRIDMDLRPPPALLTRGEYQEPVKPDNQDTMVKHTKLLNHFSRVILTIFRGNFGL